MKIKVAQYIADFLVNHGVTHNFTVTGGGAMHLNDALGHKEGLKSIYNHHEQACAIAAEGYARLTGRVASVCVTSGPGGTNAITGVLGGWQDSIPMFIISGQVKRETTTWSTDIPLRQLGDQEYQIIDSVKYMTKYAVMITSPEEIRYHLEKAWFLCNHGRKGPVWLDIPLDVQAAMVETDELMGFNSRECSNEDPVYDENDTIKIINRIKEAQRPVIFAGSGIRLGDAHRDFIDVIEKLNIPVVTAWNAHDNLWDEHPLFCGRPGTVGTRGGNFVVQNSDLLLVLGCRLNIRQISYNYKAFAPKAYKIVVDIDEAELNKPTVKVEMKIHANVKDVLSSLNHFDEIKSCHTQKHEEWLKWAREINEKYPATITEYYEKSSPMNPYAFITELSKDLKENEKIICGNGSACVVTFQTINLKKGQRLFTNSGCAAMGYGFPAAIGCSVAEKEKRVICIDGDGSFMMNLQELQTVAYNNLNLKIIILNNNGYHSIRQTQTNLFKGEPLVGVCDGNGISFPNFEKIAYAFGIPYVKADDIRTVHEAIGKMLATDGPVLLEAMIDETQNFAPKLSSKALPDGRMVSPEIDDMFPFLDRAEYEANKL